MKFKELREATLTKTQIKKVHDKADDLPKNDFIKRYGKDGDSVRFATATKMVKKELGIGEATLYLGKEYESSQFGYEATRDMKNVIDAAKKAGAKIVSQEKPSRGEPNASIEITTNNPKAVRAAIQKADSEFDIDEGFKSDAQRKAAFASGYKEKGKKKDEALDDKDKETIKPIIKQLQKSVKAHDKQAKQLQKDIQDEVELTEAGRPGEEVAQGYAKSIARKTDSNDHFGARSYLAFVIKDKELEQFYDSLEKMHRMTNGSGNHAVSLRQKMEPILKARVKKKLRPDIGKILLDAL